MIQRIAKAIATMEGYFITPEQAKSRGISYPTISQRNNNPGNLRSWGSTPISGGFAAFASAEEGWAALRRQIVLNIGRGLNLYEFFGGKPGVYAGYAPAADNNKPAQYAQFVARETGLDPTRPLSEQVKT